MFKNVSLLQKNLHGRQSWQLLGPDGCSIKAFEAFAKTLDRRSINTRRNYCRWLAEFFDYLFEAASLTPVGQDACVSHDYLVEVIEAYDEYLVLGSAAGKEIAYRVNETLPSPRISSRSSATKHAAIRRFLKLSERVRAQMLEMTNKGVYAVSIDKQALFAGISERRDIPHFQRNAMVANSMLAGVISGGPKFVEECILPTSVPDISYEQDRAFPFDRVDSVLGHLTTHRDRALYALCAASVTNTVILTH